MDSVQPIKNTNHNSLCMSVLLKALPPVCMEYTAQGENRVENVAQGEAECCICHCITLGLP